MQPFGLLLILVGAFCAAAALFDWDFVFEGRKVRSHVALLGRGGMRAIYFLIGAGMIVLGALAALGVIGAAEETHRHMR
ncbi:MAG: immunity 17 family protein [Planctomycetaceae bacterium]|nr:immunity 17 family protein [Planctomycetaceae bacterium]